MARVREQIHGGAEGKILANSTALGNLSLLMFLTTKESKSPFRASMHWLRNPLGGPCGHLIYSVPSKVLSSLQLKCDCFSQRRCWRRCCSKSPSLLNGFTRPLSALIRRLSRPGAHRRSQYQLGAEIFLSAPKVGKTRSHREQAILYKFLLVGNNCLSTQILWSRLLHIDNAEEPQ
jgi:hypothetical protein